MGIITISREFGSGGRELGKRLADELGYAYYDKEIVTAIAEKAQLNEEYIANTLDGSTSFSNIPVHFGRTFSYSPAMMASESRLFAEQNKLLKELASVGNCVIVGRAADIVLREFRPFNLFVFADLSAKVRRCQARSDAAEQFNDRQMEKQIKKIDAARKRYHSMISDIPWGDKRGYHLCINTTDRSIKAMIPAIAEYFRIWQAEEARIASRQEQE